jgi:superfamily I DNA/RNA helicase
MNELRLSEQQQTIIDWVERGSGSAFVEAVAGAGKTTTLIEATKRMRGNVALCAFNKKIADEINERVKPLNLRGVKAGTFHSFGFGAWRNVAPRVRVDDQRKTKDMLA